MISQKAKYALRALVALARAGESMMIGEVAAQERIPRKFLEQILLELKRHGIVMSKRGKLGGYMLLMPADQITFGQVLRILDGPLAPLPCLSRIAYRRCADCRTEEDCEIRHVFAKVTISAREVLDRTTIADAIASGPEPVGAEEAAARLLGSISPFSVVALLPGKQFSPGEGCSASGVFPRGEIMVWSPLDKHYQIDRVSGVIQEEIEL